MSKISSFIIEEIMQTSRIEEVIGEFVQLKRAGSNLKGLSPFTDEKTASFVVSPAKQSSAATNVLSIASRMLVNGVTVAFFTSSTIRI